MPKELFYPATHDDIQGVNNTLNSLGKMLDSRLDKIAKAIGSGGGSSSGSKIYGFHIDGNIADPYDAVTYIADAEGMEPAYMDFHSNEFNYGDWKDAFFMPRPCMLNFDGTVDYYLNENNYYLKENGEPSDIEDSTYQGNVMMEWGRDGKQIWYKIVPEIHIPELGPSETKGSSDVGPLIPADDVLPTSASVYFADHQVDENYVAWPFVDINGDLAEHFYTSCYTNTLFEDSVIKNTKENSKYGSLSLPFIRSLSGTLGSQRVHSMTAYDEKTCIDVNYNMYLINSVQGYNTDTYADIVLINLLLILMGRCLDLQSVFGAGLSEIYTTRSEEEDPYDNVQIGVTNEHGLFYGSMQNDMPVKVFGMENYWGYMYRRVAGIVAYPFSPAEGGYVLESVGNTKSITNEATMVYSYKMYGAYGISDDPQDYGNHIDWYQCTEPLPTMMGPITHMLFCLNGMIFPISIDDYSYNSGMVTYDDVLLFQSPIESGVCYPLFAGAQPGSDPFMGGPFHFIFSIGPNFNEPFVGANLTYHPVVHPEKNAPAQ